MQQSSPGLDRLTQSVLYYPCESCMDALMGNSIFVWLFLDRWGQRERNQWFSFLVFVVQDCWFAHWLKWMVLLFILDGNRNNKHKTSHCPASFEVLLVDLCFHELHLKTLISGKRLKHVWWVSQRQYLSVLLLLCALCVFLAEIQIRSVSLD